MGAPMPEYYVAAPPVPPMYAPPPVYKQEAGSSIPWWVWMAAGIVVAKVADFVSNRQLCWQHCVAQLPDSACVTSVSFVCYDAHLYVPVAAVAVCMHAYRDAC